LQDKLVVGVTLTIICIFLPFDAAIGLAVLALLGACLFTLQFAAASPNPRLTSGS
jgi:uncharacterized membrane protein